MADANQLNAALRSERTRNRELKAELQTLREAVTESKELLREHNAMLKYGGGNEGMYDENELASRELEGLKRELKETQGALKNAQTQLSSSFSLGFADLKARIKHGDAAYEERLSLTMEAIADNPNLRASIYGSEDPAEAAYQYGERVLQEKGSKSDTDVDPAPDKTRLADEDEPDADEEGLGEEDGNVNDKRAEDQLTKKLKAKEKVPAALPGSDSSDKGSLTAEKLAEMDSLDYADLPKEVRRKMLHKYTEEFLQED